MASRALVLSLLCLCLTTLSNGYPLDGPAEVHEPVSVAEVAAEIEKQEEKVQEQSAPVEQPSSDEVHEPVYPDKELPPPPQEQASSEELLPQDESKEVVSLPEATFGQYDQDGDGYIDIFEWERKIEDELAKKKFLDADSNDDDKISQEEYQVWSSPAAPQENVNEVYVPSDLVVQPVDEPQPPVGRSAEESGDIEKVVIVSDLEPLASVDSAQAGPEIAPVAVVEKDLIQEQPAQPQGQDDVAVEGPKVVAVIEDASQPAIVLLEDKKPEEPVVAAAEEAKPAMKSVDLSAPSVAEEVKPVEEKKEEVLASSSAAPLPAKEESVAVESLETPKEEIKADPQQPKVAVKTDVVPEVAQPEVAQPAQPEIVIAPAAPVVVVEEKKAEVASEEKKPEVAVEELKPEVTSEEKKPEVAEKIAQPEVAVSEQPKLPEVPEKKPEIVVSEEQKLPEELKKAEVSKVDDKPSNVISS